MSSRLLEVDFCVAPSIVLDELEVLISLVCEYAAVICVVLEDSEFGMDVPRMTHNSREVGSELTINILEHNAISFVPLMSIPMSLKEFGLTPCPKL